MALIETFGEIVGSDYRVEIGRDHEEVQAVQSAPCREPAVIGDQRLGSSYNGKVHKEKAKPGRDNRLLTTQVFFFLSNLHIISGINILPASSVCI